MDQPSVQEKSYFEANRKYCSHISDLLKEKHGSPGPDGICVLSPHHVRGLSEDSHGAPQVLREPV